MRNLFAKTLTSCSSPVTSREDRQTYGKGQYVISPVSCVANLLSLAFRCTVLAQRWNMGLTPPTRGLHVVHRSSDRNYVRWQNERYRHAAVQNALGARTNAPASTQR